ncbi:MAG: YerC/YecD family TrpR-related protein [Rudaea sp.]
MKHRFLQPELPTQDPIDGLCQALLSLDRIDQMRAFLRDLCTPAELEALADRWRVVPYLLQGMAYREIHDRTSVSVTTIGRVARFLSQGNGGYHAAIAHHALTAPAQRKAKSTPRATSTRRVRP